MTIKEKALEYKSLLKDLDKGLEEIEGGAISEARGAELEKKAKRAEQLQRELDPSYSAFRTELLRWFKAGAHTTGKMWERLNKKGKPLYPGLYR